MRVPSVSKQGLPRLDDVEDRRQSQSPCAAPGIPQANVTTSSHPQIRSADKQGGRTNEREGTDDAIGSYATKAEAETAGRNRARQDESEHIIHTKDGQIS